MLISKREGDHFFMYAHTDYNGQYTYFWRRHCPGPDSWPVESSIQTRFKPGLRRCKWIPPEHATGRSMSVEDQRIAT